ncbi:hypothetical protein MAR_037494 [Mya arenaria]|uniref:Uncharacterized protein n=1 Tax=Mya arenaria TaxID=6604 RepID=A0ABY7FNN1_MYAAR|nr:hypothetical protein MAR_037494 [Mya arenaria]
MTVDICAQQMATSCPLLALPDIISLIAGQDNDLQILGNSDTDVNAEQQNIFDFIEDEENDSTNGYTIPSKVMDPNEIFKMGVMHSSSKLHADAENATIDAMDNAYGSSHTVDHEEEVTTVFGDENVAAGDNEIVNQGTSETINTRLQNTI